jgi:hypothetical protein
MIKDQTFCKKQNEVNYMLYIAGREILKAKEAPANTSNQKVLSTSEKLAMLARTQ